jgi:asparagine synthase (glutamine-hydrolysing)
LDGDLIREGLRRLRPLDALGASLIPEPGSGAGRISVLESAHYMRNQLLRDADWAGMAHGVEIRVPFVDVPFLETVAPCFAGLTSGAGKAALARAPSLPLPDEMVGRAKTGFAVPTGTWMAKQTSAAPPSTAAGARKGMVSRHWARVVFGATTASAGKTV